MTPGPRVEVIWHDAHGESTSWVHLEEVGVEPCVVRTVGILLRPGKRGHLTVAQSVEGDHADHLVHIPLGMVRNLTALTDGATLPIDKWHR